MQTLHQVPQGATARRPSWKELPDAVRTAVEERLGARVVRARSQDAGFTAGFASRLRLDDGSGAFVKAVNGVDHPSIRLAYRQEAAVVAALPDRVPAPRLRWSAELDGGWFVLAFHEIDGRPPHRPWRVPQLRAVLAALGPLAAALTPVPQGMPALPSVAHDQPHFGYWRELADDPDAGALLPRHPHLPRQRMERLAELEERWVAAASGDCAVHFDLRDDNVLLDGEGAVWICDWNWLTVGAPWLDLVGLLVAAHGDGLDADAALAAHPLARGVPPRAVDAFLAALAGYYTAAAGQEHLPSSPWLRHHQAWYRDATMSWLGRRLRW